MKTLRSSRSASVRLRALIAVALCLASVSLVATAFGAWSGLSTAAWIQSSKPPNLLAKLKPKARKPGEFPRHAMGAPSRPGSTSVVPDQTAPASSSNYTPNTVAQYTNASGQTVYSISPSHFDGSPPLTEAGHHFTS
jgi:hypothetical protein